MAPLAEVGPLTVSIENRPYDLHRPHGSTTLLFERRDWPGNEFGFWLPESVASWGNWQEGRSFQEWEISPQGRGECRQHIDEGELLTTFAVSPQGDALWFGTTVTNRTERTLTDVSVQSCFHFVNAPEFISVHGERLWACLDGAWTTTDTVPRHLSLDPRRVRFHRAGSRPDRSIEHITDFPQSIMPQEACHPLFIAESFGAKRSVGIACEHYSHLFNNNDSILRCLHSHPQPITELPPGGSGTRQGVVVFCDGDHEALRRRYEELVPDGKWPAYDTGRQGRATPAA